MNKQEILEGVVADQLKNELPVLTIGDTVNVHRRIIEGEKERIQVYQGVVIAQAGSGINQSITVRRIVANEGVEIVFPVHSPRVAKIEIVRRGDARRAKLYYLRKRVGRKRRLRDRRRGLDALLVQEQTQADQNRKAQEAAAAVAATAVAEGGDEAAE
ncbi:MAG: 50S ribosomal protein L19 [Planctomycetes bacterium]|nr:50S ribosomal protein L19 [Planctomycetota bacterium]NOG55985.1 50S ribosomal protein L19 [Planctomycetota bacterium]